MRNREARCFESGECDANTGGLGLLECCNVVCSTREATRPTMRFVPVKSPEQQSVMVLHRTRSILIRQRIQISNAIRSHMAEFGMAAAVGRQGLQALTGILEDSSDTRVPAEAEAVWACRPRSCGW